MARLKRFTRRASAALLSTLLVLTLLPLPGGASEPFEEEIDETEDGIRQSEQRLKVPEGASDRGMWLWPEGRRAFFVGPPSNNQGVGFGHELIAVDLDTGEVRAKLGITDPLDRGQLRRHLEEIGRLDDDPRD